MSAAERHKQRLGAASVRIDMVDTLGQMDGSPSAEQIAAWLDHLTDEEVLERMSRLKPTHTYNPDIVLHNFEVLKEMRDEAAAFGVDEKASD